MFIFRGGGVLLDGAGKVVLESCKVFDVDDGALADAAARDTSAAAAAAAAAAYEVRSCDARIKKCQVSALYITLATHNHHTSHVTSLTTHHSPQAISCGTGLLWGISSWGSVVGCVFKNCGTGLKCAQVTAASAASSAAPSAEDGKRCRKVLKLNCEDCETGVSLEGGPAVSLQVCDV
jgi:hypothetical protein